MRLHHLADWASGWQLRNMFAGTPGSSADDAWYLNALDVEHAQATNMPFVGGAVDNVLTKLLGLCFFSLLLMPSLGPYLLLI